MKVISEYNLNIKWTKSSQLLTKLFKTIQIIWILYNKVHLPDTKSNTVYGKFISHCKAAISSGKAFLHSFSLSWKVCKKRSRKPYLGIFCSFFIHFADFGEIKSNSDKLWLFVTSDCWVMWLELDKKKIHKTSFML